MAIATIIKRIVDISDPQYESNLYAVEMEDKRGFKIKAGGVDNNYAVIVQTYIGTNLQEIAEIIEGCFMKESNFFKAVSEYFKCNQIVKLEYNQTSVLIYRQNISAERIVRAWKRQEKLLKAGNYYVIGVRKLKPYGEYDGKCFVLAGSEKEAIRKVKRGYVSCECVCFGKYNKRDNTFILKNADKYLEFGKMFKIDD